MLNSETKIGSVKQMNAKMRTYFYFTYKNKIKYR